MMMKVTIYPMKPKIWNYNDNNEGEDFVTEDILDPNNPELTNNKDDNEIIPAAVQPKYAGTPRSNRSLANFYNPNP
jgi:hypothetical protein